MYLYTELWLLLLSWYDKTYVTKCTVSSHDYNSDRNMKVISQIIRSFKIKTRFMIEILIMKYKCWWILIMLRGINWNLIFTCQFFSFGMMEIDVLFSDFLKKYYQFSSYGCVYIYIYSLYTFFCYTNMLLQLWIIYHYFNFL
jgi:hypothetical protein